jgi:DNA-binding NarL/FixJ family response regulator
VPNIRVLVVDDYRPFRQFTCATLGKNAELQVVGEAADGFEAVQKAVELRPELIVLDIGLPGLSGLEAARRIRKLSSESRIIFVTQESSTDVVREALSLGGQGYVVKTHAGKELLAAVEAVNQGKRFIGSGLVADHFTGATDFQTSDIDHEDALTRLAPMKGESARSHMVEFYSDDEAFLDGFGRYMEIALLGGNAVILVATEAHREDLLRRLQERGVAIEPGRCLALDVNETLSTFMDNDLPDPVRFQRVVGDLIAEAARATAGEKSRVTICGECASILWTRGNADGAIKLEQLCDQIAKRYGIDILCGFSLSDFYREEDKEVFQRICDGC